MWDTATLLDYFSGDGMSTFSGMRAALDTREWVAVHAATLAGSMVVGLLCFFALTGLRHLVKRDLLAATVAAMFFTLINSSQFTSSNWQVKTAIYLFVFAALLLVLLRFGLVTIMAASFVIDTFNALGLGEDWKAWYIPGGLATVALLAGIAIYAFWRSMGTRTGQEEAAG